MNLDLSAAWIFLASLLAAMVVIGATVGLIAWFATVRGGGEGEGKREKAPRKERHGGGRHIAHGV